MLNDRNICSVIFCLTPIFLKSIIHVCFFFFFVVFFFFYVCYFNNIDVPRHFDLLYLIY